MASVLGVVVMGLLFLITYFSGIAIAKRVRVTNA